MIFQSHFPTILLSLAILKNSCLFWKNSCNFFYKKQILNVLITLTFFVVFCDKLATFTDFYIIHFFSKKSSVLRKKLNVLRSPTISVAFYDKLATFTDFSDFHFFQKLRHLFKKKRTSWKILTFSVAILRQFCYFSDFRKFMFFSGKTHLIFFKKSQILNILRTFTIFVAFYDKIATFTDF